MEKKIIFLGDSITAWNSELKNIENKLSFIINILESLEGEKGFI